MTKTIQELQADLEMRSMDFLFAIAKELYTVDNYKAKLYGAGNKIGVINKILEAGEQRVETAILNTPDDGKRGRIKNTKPEPVAPEPEIIIKKEIQVVETIKHIDPISAALENVVKTALATALGKDEVTNIIRDEIKKFPPYKLDITVNNSPVKQIDGYARPEFKYALELAANRLNILMVGAAGCGKTYIAKQVAEALSLRFGSISCSSGMSESHLTGWLLPTSSGGAFEYVKSVFVDIYENGGVFLFDEIDAADSNTLLFVNQALANGGFFLPQRHNNPEVKKHKDCIIMAAANTYGTGGNIIYAGRERLDESTLDRFRAGVIEVGYDETLESNLVEPEILTWGKNIRRKINDTKLQRVMSTRFLLDASKLKRSGVPMDKLQKTYFHGWREDEIKKVA